MAKKNTNFTLGLNRQELKQKAIELGKTQQQVNKANSRSLEKFIQKNDKSFSNIATPPKEKRTRKPYDKNFQFGVGREDLKKLAVDLGYKGKVGKANTKALEKFVQNKLIGRGKDVEFTETMKKDVSAFFKSGYHKGKAYLAEKMPRVAGIDYGGYGALENEVAKQFSVYYQGEITKEILDELMYTRMQYRYLGEAFNGLKNTFEYVDLFKEYARELTEAEGKEYEM